jgi:DNA-binding MarR family transcriptional regulator
VTVGRPRGNDDRERAALHEAARAHSTATVLFHAAMNERQGLSATEGKALDLLARHGPRTAGQLAVHTGLARASVTELVDRLEAKGFVRRRRDERDRRRVLVEFTPEKLTELAAVFERFGQSVDSLWDEFSAEELEVIRRFLERATSFLEEAAARLAEGDETGR